MPPIPSEQRSPYPGRRAAVPAVDAASGSDHRPASLGARGPPPPDFQILLEHEVLALTRLSNVTIWRLERRRAFPLRIKLTGKRVGWLEHEVLGWIADRMAARVA
jgi:prophage regulatory protein